MFLFTDRTYIQISIKQDTVKNAKNLLKAVSMNAVKNNWFYRCRMVVSGSSVNIMLDSFPATSVFSYVRQYCERKFYLVRTVSSEQFTELAKDMESAIFESRRLIPDMR